MSGNRTTRHTSHSINQTRDQANLADSYLRGHGVTRDVEKAVELLQAAATARYEPNLKAYGPHPTVPSRSNLDGCLHDPQSAYRLGLLLFFGLGIEQNRTRAMRYFVAAKASGHEDAALLVYTSSRRPNPAVPDKLHENEQRTLRAQFANFEALRKSGVDLFKRREELLERERQKLLDIGLMPTATPDVPAHRHNPLRPGL